MVRLFTFQFDRYIPSRSALDLENAHFNFNRESEKLAENMENGLNSPSKELYKQQLAQRIFASGSEDSKILAFKAKAPQPSADAQAHMQQLYSANGAKAVSRKQSRHVPQAPERILDAPELLDDYYLNLLDWSSTNQVAICLGSSVYVWNAASGDVSELMSTSADSDDPITRWVLQ